MNIMMFVFEFFTTKNNNVNLTKKKYFIYLLKNLKAQSTPWIKKHWKILCGKS